MSSFLSASTSRKDYEGDSQCGAYDRMSLADGPVLLYQNFARALG
jgi:hypothetical protein